ncbi:MAG: hypothetical protein EOP05_02250 [Proteobacteria bacterium]|nr:MAG: hypothetical protein EOP05_02250 [Pseudomonadota bacterium]
MFKAVLVTLTLLSSTAFAKADLVNCHTVLEAKKIPSCTELVDATLAGRPGDVKKGQRWADESQDSSAYETYVTKGNENICVQKFSSRARATAVCGG